MKNTRNYELFILDCNLDLLLIMYFLNINYKPIESPEVIFYGKSPEHEHIYSNGFICLSILYDGFNLFELKNGQLP